MLEDNNFYIEGAEGQFNDELECFARINKVHCNALTEKKCKGCPFFKLRKDINNNPYYGYSYKTEKEHEDAIRKRKINPEDVIY